VAARKTLFIPGWDEHFENAQSRKYDSLSWVPFPNAHDGNGFARVATLGDPDACRIFTAFILIIQVAAKMPIRGLLWDKGEPLDTEDLAMKTRFPKAIFDDAIPILTGRKIAWIAWGKVDDDGTPDPDTTQTLGSNWSSATSERPATGRPVSRKKEPKGKERNEPKGSVGSDDKSSFSSEDILTLSSGTIMDPNMDPIEVAFAITEEDRKSESGKRAAGFYRKALKKIGDHSFRGILDTFAAEIRAGEDARNRGAVLTNKLKGAMK